MIRPCRNVPVMSSYLYRALSQPCSGQDNESAAFRAEMSYFPGKKTSPEKFPRDIIHEKLIPFRGRPGEKGARHFEFGTGIESQTHKEDFVWGLTGAARAAVESPPPRAPDPAQASSSTFLISTSKFSANRGMKVNVRNKKFFLNLNPERLPDKKFHERVLVRVARGNISIRPFPSGGGVGITPATAGGGSPDFLPDRGRSD